MDSSVLRDIGLTENEIKIYLILLQNGPLTAYELGQKTGIYRAHVYDKAEQLMDKGLVTHIYKGAKKQFQAASPQKINEYLAEKQKEIEAKQQRVAAAMPELLALTTQSTEQTKVEVFKGPEGLKHFLRDIIKMKTEVLITGIDDAKYQDALPIFMKQYFRDLRLEKIKERDITIKRKGVFQFGPKTAPTTEYRYLTEEQFNPTNTFVYAEKVVIVTWGTPASAVMIQNKSVAATYRSHFEHLWRIADKRQ